MFFKKQRTSAVNRKWLQIMVDINPSTSVITFNSYSLNSAVKTQKSNTASPAFF